MGDNSISVCPYRAKVTDPSSIQTEQYEVQTQKFELQTQTYEFQPPPKLEVQQQTTYGKPLMFTGTSKDLALLAACEKGSVFEHQILGKLLFVYSASWAIHVSEVVLTIFIETLGKDLCLQLTVTTMLK